MIQNKLLWAISQQTASELVYRRVDASLPLLGMQSYDKDGELNEEVVCVNSTHTTQSGAIEGKIK